MMMNDSGEVSTDSLLAFAPHIEASFVYRVVCRAVVRRDALIAGATAP